MINHTDLGQTPFARLKALQVMVAAGQITFGGNKKDKIYGKLNCKAGKRMKAQNRAFFADEQEAIDAGYRPCGSCMRREYQNWKLQNANKHHQGYNQPFAL
jgi:methylphosphotriester-DNA--protein-cysteine methyltransferase